MRSGGRVFAAERNFHRGTPMDIYVSAVGPKASEGDKRIDEARRRRWSVYRQRL